MDDVYSRLVDIKFVDKIQEARWVEGEMESLMRIKVDRILTGCYDCALSPVVFMCLSSKFRIGPFVRSLVAYIARRNAHTHTHTLTRVSGPAKARSQLGLVCLHILLQLSPLARARANAPTML